LISIDCLNQRQFEQAIAGAYAPALASLREDALSYTRAYANAPWTTPSHMSMLTGLYPNQHGREVPWRLMLKTNQYFDRVPRFTSIPQLLRANGYETTAFVGKGPISAQFGLAEGFDSYSESAKNERNSDLPANVEHFLQWLDGRGDEPFFLFFHTFDLHLPRPTGASSDRQALAYVDRQLGAVLEELKRRKRYEDALIILTGDHGSQMVRTAGKCCIHGAGHYEENLNVPLLVKLPGSAAVGEIDRVVRHVDLLSTVMDVVGISPTEYRGYGRSVLSVDEEVEPRMSFSSADARCVRRYGLVDRRYKYIYTPRDDVQTLLRSNPLFVDGACRGVCADLPAIEELYDLAEDPFEERNLLSGEADRETQRVLDRFRSAMVEHLNLPPQYARTVVGNKGVTIDPELEESLEALGYLR